MFLNNISTFNVLWSHTLLLVTLFTIFGPVTDRECGLMSNNLSQNIIYKYWLWICPFFKMCYYYWDFLKVIFSSPSCLGDHKLWKSADPSAAAFPTWCGGHEDISHPVRVPSPAGLQELHTPHYSTGNSHSQARCQPQQSIGYHAFMKFYSTSTKMMDLELPKTYLKQKSLASERFSFYCV